jgi:drug/metabolite transporter (DMT)-like permease
MTGTPKLRPVAAAAWMMLAQSLFGVMSVGARLGGREVPWQEIAASRFLVGATTAFVVARLRGQSLAITKRGEAWLRSIFGTLAAFGTFFTLASPSLAMGDAVTLFQTSPIFVSLLSWPLLGERVRPSVVAAIAVAFVGIVAVARPSFASAGPVVIVAALTAASSAMAMIWLRRIGPGESSEAIVFHFSCVGFGASVVASIPVWQTPDAHGAAFLLLAGLSGGLAQLCMTRAYSIDIAARVSAMGFSGVVFARLFAFPVFGEVPSVVQAAGSALVIVSGVLLALRGRAAEAHARELAS